MWLWPAPPWAGCCGVRCCLCGEKMEGPGDRTWRHMGDTCALKTLQLHTQPYSSNQGPQHELNNLSRTHTTSLITPKHGNFHLPYDRTINLTSNPKAVQTCWPGGPEWVVQGSPQTHMRTRALITQGLGPSKRPTSHWYIFEWKQ